MIVEAMDRRRAARVAADAGRWARRERRREPADRPVDPRRVALIAVSAVVYWLADRGFDAGRGDFFYLADAFLHGRTWLTSSPGRGT